MSSDFLFRNFVSSKKSPLHSAHRPLNPLCASHRRIKALPINIKKTVTNVTVFFNVVKVTNLEPFDKKILAKLDSKCNIYHKLVLTMKLATQEYYNMRMALGLKEL